MRNNHGHLLVAALLSFILPAWAADSTTLSTGDFITPGSNLVIEGVPPLEKSLAERIEAYTDANPSAVIAWHPAGKGLLVRRRLSNTNQLHLVNAPGEMPQPVTDFPDSVSSASFQPKKGEYLLFAKANGGDEIFRLYRLDWATKAVTALSPEGERAGNPGWNRAGDRVVFSTVTVDRNNKSGADGERKATTKLYLADPLKPDSARVVATFVGGSHSGFRFSPDGKRLLFEELVSANESHLWFIDIVSGKQKRLTPAPRAGVEPVAYNGARFSHDGKSVYATSDRGSEFRRLVRINAATGKETVLTAHLAFDVDEFAISYSAGRIAFTTNENGTSVLRFLDLTTGKELPRPALVDGVISGLRWQRDEDEGSNESKVRRRVNEIPSLAFNLSSARSPGEVYSYDLAANKVTRWTNGASTRLNAMDFVEPQRVTWPSFDQRRISGFLYAPDAKKFPGKRPVMINIHGGPEGQSRPGFLGRNNYFVNELGIAIIYPNVRGSTGFGKTWLALDNGMKREDSVKDIGALFDWIAQQPQLDASKVLVIGGSYGGYMSLAVSTHYADRIAGAIDVVGISNFVTFLNNTESYRRDLRRVEYGDERDPAMRQFLEGISPLNHADKIRKPLFVVQGRNDPRVPYTEALQIVAKAREQNTPVWFLMANDEGHGFAKKSNQDFLFFAEVKFIEQTLLR